MVSNQGLFCAAFLLVFSLATFNKASAFSGTRVCLTPLSEAKPYDTATRFLEEDGSYSRDIYWSRSATEFTLTFERSAYAHAIGEGGIFRIEVPEYKRKKLPKGSFIEISDRMGHHLTINRQIEETWNRQFTIQPAHLFQTFGEQGKLKIELRNDRKKIKPMVGELDLARLSDEGHQWPAALLRLEALQADHKNQCKWLIEPDASEDPANWDCTVTAKDEWGVYYADGQVRGMALRLSKTASISWYVNEPERGYIYWNQPKSKPAIDVIRLLGAGDGAFIGQTLSKVDFPRGFQIKWNLKDALNATDDIKLQARDGTGEEIDSALLPKSLLQHAASQIDLLTTKSIEKRKNYAKHCEAPQEIIVY